VTTNILLIGGRLTKNLGGPSLVAGTVKALSAQFENPRFTLVVPPGKIDRDQELARPHGVTVIPEVEGVSFLRKTVPMAMLRRLGIAAGPKPLRRLLQAIREADIVIDIWGIAFTDSLGANSFYPRLVDGQFYILSKILGRRFVKYTADLGPFEQKWNRFFAKLYLNRFTRLVLARDEETAACVRAIGVKTKMITCPDTAFLMEPAESAISRRLAECRRQRPVIGLSVSFQLVNRAGSAIDYLRTMADLVRHVNRKHNAHVVIIPNELSDGPHDDTKVAENLGASLADAACEVVYTEHLTAAETKGVIRECDAIVAARYHSIVAALSMGVPTFALGWHHKYAGILSLFGQEHRMCEIASLRGEELLRQFDELWQQRAEVRERILAGLGGAKSRIYAGAEETAKLLPKKRRQEAAAHA